MDGLSAVAHPNTTDPLSAEPRGFVPQTVTMADVCYAAGLGALDDPHEVFAAALLLQYEPRIGRLMWPFAVSVPYPEEPGAGAGAGAVRVHPDMVATALAMLRVATGEYVSTVRGLVDAVPLAAKSELVLMEDASGVDTGHVAVMLFLLPVPLGDAAVDAMLDDAYAGDTAVRMKKIWRQISAPAGRALVDVTLVSEGSAVLKSSMRAVFTCEEMRGAIHTEYSNV